MAINGGHAVWGDMKGENAQGAIPLYCPNCGTCVNRDANSAFCLDCGFYFAETPEAGFITLNPNGAVGASSSFVPVIPGELFTLPSVAGFSRPGYRAIGWNTRPDGSGVRHPAGSSIEAGVETVLYVEWSAEKRNPPMTVIAVVLAVLIFALVLGMGFFEGNFGCSTSPKPSIITDEKEASVVRASLEDYSWEELDGISSLISEASTESEAVAVAKHYNLVDSSGTLDPNQVKSVTVGGQKATVHIIGFGHDKESGGNSAGITFQFADCIAVRPINGSRDNAGGWKNSDLRAWLNDDAFYLLDDDLQKVIKPVSKKTNNVGQADSDGPGIVSSTSDKLWLLSCREVFGNGGADEAVGNEGSQYKLFRDAGVIFTRDENSAALVEENAVLLKTFEGNYSSWWLRSPSVSKPTLFYDVYGETGEYNWGYADTECGVAPCFCI